MFFVLNSSCSRYPPPKPRRAQFIIMDAILMLKSPRKPLLLATREGNHQSTRRRLSCASVVDVVGGGTKGMHHHHLHRGRCRNDNDVAISLSHNGSSTRRPLRAADDVVRGGISSTIYHIFFARIADPSLGTLRYMVSPC